MGPKAALREHNNPQESFKTACKWSRMGFKMTLRETKHTQVAHQAPRRL